MTNSSADQSYFMSHILPVYKRAMVWDDNLCLRMQSHLGAVYVYDEAMYQSKFYVVGSCADGSASIRTYRTSPVLEVDHLLLRDDIGWEYGQPHPDKVGVYLHTHLPRKLLWDVVSAGNPDPIGLPSPDSPQHVRDAYNKAQNLLTSNPRYYPNWYKRINRSSSNKGPSMMLALTIHNTYVLVDEVRAWHHQGWPEEAEEWRTRGRLWPPASVVEQVLQQGYQVVHKFCSSTGDIDGPAEFHTTFALCERYLAKQRTPVQKLVYLMAKTLFYTYLDLHDDDNPNIDFPSYALKTTMMWLMEQTPVDRWTEDNIPYLLRELFTHLKVSICSASLKNYFMIGADVLSNCTPNLLEKVGIKISWILSDMNKCLQETALYKCNVLLHTYHIIKGGQKAFNKLVYECQNKVIAYGLLRTIQTVHKVRATYQRIIEILERGTGVGLKAKGYLFNEEECFHVLKVMMNVHSDNYKNKRYIMMYNSLSELVSQNFNRYNMGMADLIEKVLCLGRQPEVTIIRLCVQWQDGTPVNMLPSLGCGDEAHEVMSYLHKGEWNQKMFDGIDSLPGETDLIVLREGQYINVYKCSDIGDLIEHYVRDLWDNEADRWMPQIYSLTHREIPELQLMDFARMLYLLYVCEDKIDRKYDPHKD